MAVSYMFQKLLSLHATFLIAGSSFWLCGCLYAQIKHLHSISLSLSPSLFPSLSLHLSLSLSLSFSFSLSLSIARSLSVCLGSPGEDPETRRMRTVKNIADLRQNLEDTMSSLRGTQIS